MNRFTLAGVCLALVLAEAPAVADSLWLRADPNTAFLFQSYRAHRVGDLLTLVVDETTGFDAMEKRQLNKETKTSAGLDVSLKSAAGKLSRAFTGSLSGTETSARSFDSKNNSSIDRKFTDRMTVMVIAVLPNGNMVVEGFRQRLVQREIRTLHVSGIVRPGDIGPFNTVQSQFVANFSVSYQGRGPESAYTNHGWWGRVLNVVWPY